MKEEASSEIDVKQRLLDSGITLFGIRGLTGPTVREITDRAKCNLSAMNYYFGSRERFLEAVLVHVFQPIRRRRDATLKAAIERHPDRPVPVHELVEAWILPLLEAPRDEDGGRIVVRFIQQLWADPAGRPLNFVQHSYDYGAFSYIDAFCRSLPSFTRAEIVWRYEMMRGAALHALADCDPISPTFKRLMTDQPGIDVEQTDLVRRQIVSYCASGFVAQPLWATSNLKEKEQG
nr:TetR family transcriptional regulator [Martelella sp. HB161492]